MLEPADDLRQLRARFRWRVPERVDIAWLCCGRHAARGDRPALILADEGRIVGFVELERFSSKLANVLRAHGLGFGDRLGIFLDQRLETAACHLASSKLGAIALPLFRLFGPEALEHRLADSGARIVVTDEEGADRLAPLREKLPDLEHVLTTGAILDALLERASDHIQHAETSAEDPALLIYTSGTTGPPKGALHAQRVLLGHLPGVQMPHEMFPQDGDRFWTPADWAWIGGLLDVLLPSLYFGVPVVASRPRKFDPEAATALMADHGVRNAFLPPTALKLMRSAGVQPSARGARLRSIGSGGERLGDEVLEWVRQSFGVTVNEFYGQTECNLVVANMASLARPRHGSMGIAVPGHRVAVIDEEGAELPPGANGVIAVQRPDPVMFLRYWNNPEATRGKFRGDWLVTGDLGRMDEDGFFTYLGREDDLISSAGYRIGPAEVEACIMGHTAVASCAVIGVPDELRGERVKAFVVPRGEVADRAALAADIAAFVKQRLAAHEYPREVELVESLPMTITGKVVRAELRRISGQTPPR